MWRNLSATMDQRGEIPTADGKSPYFDGADCSRKSRNHEGCGADEARKSEEQKVMQASREPSLEEILADPIAQALMRSDGVEVVALRRLLEEIHSGLSGREQG
jgi:hypothetical protein